MFERFTERARQVVVEAQNEAFDHKHAVTSGHILIGVMREEDGLGAQVLRGFLNVADLQEALLKRMPKGTTDHSGQIPFTNEGKKALELALREALALGHNYIGTEHVLLGLLRVEMVQTLLGGLGVTTEAVSDAVMAKLSPKKEKITSVTRISVADLPPVEDVMEMAMALQIWARMAPEGGSYREMLVGYAAITDIFLKVCYPTERP